MEVMDSNLGHLPSASRGDGEPAGFRYVPDFVPEAEERELLERLAGLAFREARMRGVAARRTVVHYGWDYGYESWRLSPGAPLAAFLAPLRERAATLAGLPSGELEQALVARYHPVPGSAGTATPRCSGPLS